MAERIRDSSPPLAVIVEVIEIPRSPRGLRGIQIFTELSFRKIWSTHTEGETPVPIPNTEVKTLRANGSVVVRLCESRSVLL